VKDHTYLSPSRFPIACRNIVNIYYHCATKKITGYHFVPSHRRELEILAKKK
jgi:hypothetical protein